MLLDYPICSHHGARAKYLYLEASSQDHILNCAECIYDFHADNVSKLIRIDKVIDQAQTQFNNLSLNDNIQVQLTNTVNSLKQSQFLDVLQDQLNKSFETNLSETLQLAQKGSESQQSQLNSLNPTNFELLMSFFSNISEQDLPQLADKVQLVLKVTQNLQTLSKNSEVPNLNSQIKKVQDELARSLDVYENAIQEASKTFQDELFQSFNQQIFFSGPSIWNWSFDPNLINRFSLGDNNKYAVCGSGCHKDKKVFSSQQLPTSGQIYWEVERNHTSGCYDSVGVTTNHSLFSERNGTTSDGWAVRLYGSHSDVSFTGAIHNNENIKFFSNWEANCKIGMLYNASSNSLSYFHNGIYVGTPFRNVQGTLYFLVEGCHLGGFRVVDDVQSPADSELDQVSSPVQPIY